MNFNGLEYFVTVAEAGSIRKAAQTLFITEQSLSERIKKLEYELEAPLFHRSRPLTLTREGEILLAGAKQILSVYEKTVQQIQTSVNSGSEDTVRIGIDPIGYPSFMPNLAARFHRAYPQYSLEIINNENREKHADLRLLPWYDMQPLDRIMLAKDTACILVSEQLLRQIYGRDMERIIEKAQSGDVSDLLNDLPFIDASEAKNTIWPLLGVPEQPPILLALSDSLDMDFTLCLAGRGALFAPERDIRERLKKEKQELVQKMVVCPIINLPEFGLTIGYEPGHVFTAAENAFIEMAKTYFED